MGRFTVVSTNSSKKMDFRDHSLKQMGVFGRLLEFLLDILLASSEQLRV